MNSNTNIHRDITQPDDHPQRHSMEIANGTNLINELAAIQNAVDHDQPVTHAMIGKARDALKSMTVRAGNRELPLQDPEMQNNMRIWHEILNGDLENRADMTAITDAVATALVEMNDWSISLEKVTFVTDEQARILSRCAGLQLGVGLTEITDEQAQIFEEFNGTTLHFDRLTRVTDIQAAAFAAFPGEELSFENLAYTTDRQAESWASFGGELLSLPRLTDVTDDQVESLSQFYGNVLSVSIGSLTDIKAEAMAQFGGNELYLNGFTRMTDKQAGTLAAFGGRHLLALGDLSRITPAQAAALSTFGGEELWLIALSHMTAEEAKGLMKFKGKLVLAGLRELSEDIARVFTTFEEGKTLEIGGIDSVSDAVADILAPIRKKIECNDTVSDQLQEAAIRLGLS